MLVLLLWPSSITMESQIDRDFQTAVSTQSQMCRIPVKHWESIQVHKLLFCSHFSTATGEVAQFTYSAQCTYTDLKYFHKTCFQSRWKIYSCMKSQIDRDLQTSVANQIECLQNKDCTQHFFCALSALWNARGSTSTNSAYVVLQPASRLNCILLQFSPPWTWFGLNYSPETLMLFGLMNRPLDIKQNI